jgi:hypothetical protein
MACMCGDTACPSCGAAQGTWPQPNPDELIVKVRFDPACWGYDTGEGWVGHNDRVAVVWCYRDPGTGALKEWITSWYAVDGDGDGDWTVAENVLADVGGEW